MWAALARAERAGAPDHEPRLSRPFRGLDATERGLELPLGPRVCHRRHPGPRAALEPAARQPRPGNRPGTVPFFQSVRGCSRIRTAATTRYAPGETAARFGAAGGEPAQGRKCPRARPVPGEI